jgi:prevent-host-death family protein
MAKRVGAAQAKAHFATLVAEVAFGGQRVIIERRGKPLAALVSLADYERLEQEHATPARPAGGLALAGAWRDVSDKELDTLVADIYAARERDKDRPASLES